MDLTGKTALITGSVQGIGLAIAESLAEAGARIAVHGIAGDAQIHDVCEHLRAKGSPQAEFFRGDLRQPDQIDDMMDAVEAWGGVDILVNNAGIQHTAPLADMPRETWDAILQINLSAAFATMQKALPRMAERGYGRVINIASVHGLVASKDKAPYVAAKFGLVGLSRVAALEYAAAGTKAQGGVTVNCICPGWTETAIIGPQVDARAAAHGGDRDAGIADLLSEKQPSLRTSDPSEIGALALWLCAPIAHNVTGTAIPIDGGWTAQ
ncbi:D-beta-hydroxybutyrate dehydrogenase [Thalassovita gelatinovora]|uniref:D-beta-hydroxybutyrate dehydrogenase n=1 Tax=Thalassovita gelatinovora TaxID=53501 RepID=A0A0P1FF22_THAGE|nr:3-hydroxybutyrate dehydrogenase [Thalassovita gelatinovora]QIZ79907.1 3-hydroxybutyrate dehydrogenase [Thalassovita gelatinovora]CUH66395.1 D-beta-hydroxybutyrate dehydrogenase [Thalassovita gelatinovora]SER14516.1 3-hydroxybutyrate dehydrogenase [Thalassovita gelatinovora]